MPSAAPDVYLVGPRYQHHSGHSGYEGFRRYVGTHLAPPVDERWEKRGPLGLRLEGLLGRVTKPLYTVPNLRIEAAAARHMLGRPRGARAVYHVLYGDTDAWLLGRVGRRLRRPVVASFHDGAGVLEGLHVDAGVLGPLSGVICLAESQRAYFERFVPPERVFVVPHGIDTAFFTPAPRPAAERVCITAGAHMRDFETLSRAIRLVWERDPGVRFVAISTHVGHKGVPFTLAGVEYREKLSDAALLQAYQSSSLAVYAFEWAVANNSILEAMACGLPVVATDVGGVREYVGDDAGVLCAPQDPEALAAAMLRVLDDPARAAAMGAAARRRAVAHDYRAVAGQLAQVYNHVLLQFEEADSRR